MTTLSDALPRPRPAMKYRPLGRTGLEVSVLSFGASSLGGVFRPVDEQEGIRAVHVALDLGINYFDVAPAYGGTRAETLLGRALRGVPRDAYYLSTKVGKHTSARGGYGDDRFDYSRAGIRSSLDDSARRLGVDYFDVVHLHDIEYQGRRHVEWALGEGLTALQELRREGRLGAVSFGIHPIDLWRRVLAECDIQAALVHNHYCLNDTRLLELLPLVAAKGIGLINGSPFASGLLTDRGPADWHPASAEDRAVFRRAAEHCRRRGASISQLALRFACQHPEIPTTLFSSASPESVRRNVMWHGEPADPVLLSEVRAILRPVCDKEWGY
ncbi:MAG TPA: aldo/keto reductase [Vicinamibacteria bacterium]|nr:aldo/keto reductase [Vicinamibacteria bacterium]